MKFPKPIKPKRPGKTKEERDHLNWIASQGCMICGKSANIHHLRKYGEPRNHFRVIPLCYNHHQGCPDGLHHMGKKAWEKKFGSELDMLEILNRRKLEN